LEFNHLGLDAVLELGDLVLHDLLLLVDALVLGSPLRLLLFNLLGMFALATNFLSQRGIEVLHLLLISLIQRLVLGLVIGGIQHRLELLRQELVIVHVEGDLLSLLGEDSTGEEHVEGVVDAASQVLNPLSVKFLLGQNFLITLAGTGFEE